MRRVAPLVADETGLMRGFACLVCRRVFDELPFFGCCSGCYQASDEVRAAVDEAHSQSIEEAPTMTITRTQLAQIAATFACVGGARVEFPPDKYEALRALVLRCDDFTVELSCVDGRYIERKTVHIYVNSVEFVATKTTPSVILEVAS